MIKSRGTVGAIPAFRAATARNRSNDPIRPLQSHVANLIIAAVGHQQTPITGNRDTVRIVKPGQRVGSIHVAAHTGQPGNGPDHPIGSRLGNRTNRMVAGIRHK